jgi:hypothetical protein
MKGGATMAGLRHLVIVLPGIGGSVLERPASMGRPADVVWDAGLSDIAELVRRPANISLVEHPYLRAIGLVRSRRLLPGGQWSMDTSDLSGNSGAFLGSKSILVIQTNEIWKRTWLCSRTTFARASCIALTD